MLSFYLPLMLTVPWLQGPPGSPSPRVLKSLLSLWLFSRSGTSDSCDPINCSAPGSPDHGISQARILEWVAISLSRGSS